LGTIGEGPLWDDPDPGCSKIAGVLIIDLLSPLDIKGAVVIHSQIGKIRNIGGNIWIETSIGDTGCVVYGPYQILSMGVYTVEFDIVTGDNLVDDSICCIVDVVRDLKTVVEKSISRSDLTTSNGKVSITFDVHNEGQFEFRVHATGAAALTVRHDRPVKLINQLVPDFSPILAPGESTRNDFFATHFRTFNHFHANGIRFQVSDQEIIANYSGVSFLIQSKEDFQLIVEIFEVNEYNILSGREKLILDIGMNIGLTSLFMANMPSVREVHSFEPFDRPYQRALRNFELNPHIAWKIKANHYGLSDKNAQSSVLVSQDATIGTSVRGKSSGIAETIEVRNAADVIRTLAAKAEAENLDLIVKIDCEGSEFPIFEMLEKEQLLKKIDATVIEWHKWWSTEKTQQDLIRPLLDANFIVIDRTEPNNPHAGLLYAVRTVK
jgi:FkbM family methyltransferase